MDANLPRWFQLFMGVAEVAAAVGLILPGLTRMMPFLVTWAAVGIMIIMVSATGYHAFRGEYSSSVITFILLLMATFVVYGRQRLRPIAPEVDGLACSHAVQSTARTPSATDDVRTPPAGASCTMSASTFVPGRFARAAAASRCSGTAICGVTVRPALHSTSCRAPLRPGTTKSTSRPCSSRKP